MATTLEQETPSSLGPNVISDALASVTARLRLVRWVRHASRGALAGIAVCLVFAALSHFNIFPDWLYLEAVIPIVLLLGIGIGTLTAFLRPIALMDVARLAEARLGLKERLSSALEFERAPQAALAPDAALLMRLQSEDAATYARSLKAVDAVPWKWPWESKAALGGLLLLLLALILPNLPMLIPPGVQIERKIVSKAGDKLQQTAKLIAKQADLQNLEGTRRAAANMQRLGQRLSQGHLDKKQAMVQMSKLTQQMRAEQQKMAQQNGGPGAGAKSMALAGQQMAQAMSSASGSSGSKSSSGGQKAGGGNKSNQKNGAQGANGGKNGASDKKSGFNIPGAGKHPENQSGKSSANTPSTPEMQKAAQAMQQNDAKGLSEQLRQLASRSESGKMSAGDQQQAAQDLKKLSEALKNTPMKETQQHSQAAADAMKRGDKSAAASEMRKAAEAAEREAQKQADQSAQADAQKSVEGAESEMAGANSAGDIQDDSGRPGQGQGKGKGQGKGSGAGQGEGAGDGQGQGLPGSNGKHGSGKGNGGSGGGGMAGGKPSDTGQGSSPLKHLGHINPDSPRNGKLYFGKPLNAGPSKTGPMRKVGSNPNTPAGQTASKVPYYDYVAPARTSAESTMDKEDIPPAYRSDVRRYFNSLQPPTSGR